MGEHTDAVRRVYERWSEGDFASGVEPYDAETELVMRPPLPDPGSYFGPEGIRNYTQLFFAPWDRITIEATEIHDHGDRVLVRVWQRGTGSRSGIETEMRYFMVWTFRGQTVARLESIRDEAEALAAVGAA
jgi:ketosteroid isomerase-like protein